MEAGKKKIIERIKEYVRQIEPDSEITLFGSRARNESKEDSDWDILILVPGEVSLKKEQEFRHKLFELELLFGQAISTFVYSKTDWESKHQVTPLYENIKREGITI